jgi:K+-sensing histidine kinase KdpD
MPSTQENDSESHQSYQRLQRISHQSIVLRNITRLLSKPEQSTEDTMAAFVHAALEGFSGPEMMACRVSLFGSCFETDDFSEINHRVRRTILSPEDKDAFIETGFLNDDGSAVFSDDDEVYLSSLVYELKAYIERKQLMAIQEQQTTELELYASLMRHDLQNDIGLVLSNLDLVGMLVVNESPELHEALETAGAVCERMTNLLTMLGMNTNRSSVRIADILRESNERARKVYPDMQIVEKLEDMGNMEIPSSRLIPLVFDNLLRNAAIHAGANVTVTVTGRLDEDQAVIRFHDDGPGVSAAIRNRIFERGASSRAGGGYGLYLCREVLRIISGSISFVDSPNTRGACFVITIPLRTYM